MQVFLDLNGEVKITKTFSREFPRPMIFEFNVSLCTLLSWIFNSTVVLSNSLVSRFEMKSSALGIFNKAESLMIFAVFSATL